MTGTALTNLNYNAILNPPAIISYNTPATFLSTFKISGNKALNNATTCISSLNVSGTITASGNKLNFPNTLDEYKNIYAELIIMASVLLLVHFNIPVKVIIHFIIVGIMLIHLQ